MTINDITYFLEVAKCKSFSIAAENLYITQPTLGRQMTRLETELNTQLLIRSNKGISLTPAGIVMEQEFQQLLDHLDHSIKKCQLASQGYTGTLKIGILSGLNISPLIRKLISFLESGYPNIRIDIKCLSHGELARAVSHLELDIALTMDLTFMDSKNVNKMNIKPYQPAFFIPASHPLADKELIVFSDLKNEDIVIVKGNDCPAGESRIVKLCQTFGSFYPNFFYADTMEDAILWIESGLKCAILNTEMSLIHSSAVKMYPFTEIEPEDTWIQAVYSTLNQNFALAFVIKYLQENFPSS